MAKLVHVAVGVVVDGSGHVLIAKRPDTAHQGGLWEFPGGKVDAGETIEQALARELYEELAITVRASEPLIQIRHHYPDKSVLLDVHKVTDFSGVPVGNEGQPIRWVTSDDLIHYDFPAANRPIVTAIQLPQQFLITGEFASSVHFAQRLASALQKGIRIVQLRITNLSLINHHDLLASAFKLCKQYGAKLLINTSLDEFERIQQAFYEYPMAGLHLNRHQLFTCNSRPVPNPILLGASCHNLAEIEQAQKLGVDYLLLSPVAETSSHPGAEVLGWDQFAEWVKSINVPVYALGGMQVADLPVARAAGAQGIAGIGYGWK